MNQPYILDTFKGAVTGALLLTLLCATFSVLFEPFSSRAAVDTDTFTVRQEITSEISFIATAADVTMSPSIPGITGGTAAGTTSVRVSTNDTAGYNMTIDFSNTVAMQGETQSGQILNYTPGTTSCASGCQPDYTFSVGANTGEFAYSVTASTSADVDPTFADNGVNVCGFGGSQNNEGVCWLNPSTTAETIINRSSDTTSSGATTSLHFRVELTSNPSPAIPEDFYTATATLTATTN